MVGGQEQPVTEGGGRREPAVEQPERVQVVDAQESEHELRVRADVAAGREEGEQLLPVVELAGQDERRVTGAGHGVPGRTRVDEHGVEGLVAEGLGHGFVGAPGGEHGPRGLAPALSGGDQEPRGRGECVCHDQMLRAPKPPEVKS